MRIEPAYVSAFANAIRECGHDPAQFGLKREAIVDEDELFDLFARVLVVVKDPTLALRLGTSLHIGTHGVLGHALMSCRTLRQAAEILVRHNPLRSRSGSVSLALTPEQAILTFTPPFQVPGAPWFLPEVFLAAGTAVIRQLSGSDISACSLEFAHAPHMEEKNYQAILGLPVFFGRTQNRFLGPRAAVDFPLPTANDAVAEMYLRQCDKLLREMDAASGCASEVRHALLSSRGRFPSAKEVAVSLNMSERTLRRRLDEEATSFMQIVDDVRNHLAKQYLAETKLTIAEVGELLGFDDAANFRRAFKRWNGYPPRSMRETDLTQAPDAAAEAAAKAAD